MTISSALNSQLIVPITIWGSRSPTHCISSIILTNDYRTVITGCNDGQICIWDLDEGRKSLTPKSLLFGHTSSVLCLANGKQEGGNMGNLGGSGVILEQHFVSSSESGEMSLWDLSDGRCIETVKLQHVHTNIHTYTIDHKVRFFCNGYYAEILVLDGLTLEVLFTLNSKLNPDWISAIHVLRPTRSQDDVVIGLSIAGVMKVWTLSGSEAHCAEPIYENESKPIRCLNALSMTCCAYNQRTLMIVCAKYWQIYDVGDFALLCSVENRRGERWAGGDFLSAERVIIWSDVGKAYLYKLPVNKLKGKAITSCIPESADFRKPSTANLPYLYATLQTSKEKRLLCPPAMAFYNLGRITTDSGLSVAIPKVVLRGDSYGRIALWAVPEVGNWDMISDKVPAHEPAFIASLSNAWASMKTSPCGIIDNLLKSIDGAGLGGDPSPRYPSPGPHPTDSLSRESSTSNNSNNSNTTTCKLTASVYIPALGRLVCGREDGTIVIVSANQTIMLQLLLGRHLSYDDWPHHQILYGHSGRVNTLLYPHQLEERYDVAHLISGGVDFSVCLWDIFTGALLHRFSVHAGEITQMFAPPKECSARVLTCVCSVASDHSVALISLRERKCLMLASRHLFPISTIKWRPLDDYMIVGCIDGSIYVWQMETGHLDRVLHGMAAEEILSACDASGSVTTAGDRFVNPALHLFRGLRHRNLAAIKAAAARGLHNISTHLERQRMDVIDGSIKGRGAPLLIQGLRTNPKDQESHILFFDVEALIVQLLSEEYAQLSPNTLESRGLTRNLEYKRYSEMASSPETAHKLSGLLAKMKDTAENAAQKIQAKADSIGFKSGAGDISVNFHRKSSVASGGSGGGTDDSMPRSPGGRGSMVGGGGESGGYTGETHLPMEIARLLISLLHAWGLDPDLDKVCESKLGLLRPLRPVCFGQISKGGYMSLLLPTYLSTLDDQQKPSEPEKSAANQQQKPNTTTKSERHVKIVSALPTELQLEEEMARRFTSRLHWELSTALTTNHLLSLISMAHTMMSMGGGSGGVGAVTFAGSGSFASDSNRRKLIRKLSRQGSTTTTTSTSASQGQLSLEDAAEMRRRAEQAKESWNLFASLHCRILPDLLARSSAEFKRPLVEILARRWQDRCIEIRMAAQSLLLAELKLAGSKGRRAIVEEWSPFLPTYTDNQMDHGGGGGAGGGNHQGSHHGSISGAIGGGQPMMMVNRSAPTAIPGAGGGGGGGGGGNYHGSMASSPMPSPMSDHSGSGHLPGGGGGGGNDHPHSNHMESDGEADDDEADDGDGHLSSSLKALKGVGGSSVGSEGRRRQATAIILMGVIGFEYGSEITGGGVEAGSGQAPKQPPPRPAPPPRPPRPGEAPSSANGAVPNLNIPHGAGNERRKSLIEGFGGGGNYSLARKTSKALSYLLLAPPMSSLPYHTSLRRAAIDLIGRGFTVWEPYLDVSKVLLALLEFSSAEGETNLVPSGSFGLPLTPVADSSRTARAAIRAISHARPSVFITTLAREVTRYNTMQQQQQSLNFIPNQTVLYRARPEILKNLHRLIDEHQDAVYGLIIEAMDIILYCLDHNALKARGLGEMYPAITSFQNVTFCNSSKRVAVGARNGNLAIYELKTGKNQIIAAHSGKPITACAFAPDGKHLASYCAGESKVSFWLTAVGLFGLGKSQTQCVKSHPSPPMPEAVRALGPLRSAKLVWVSSKLLILLFADGKEHRFSI